MKIFAKSEKIEVTQIGKIGRKSTKAAFLDAYIGTAIGTYSVGEGYKTAALFTVAGDTNSESVGQFVKEAFEANGGTIVAEEQCQGGEQEFRAQLGNIKTANPNVVFVIINNYAMIAAFAKQAREMEITVPLIGHDGWDSQELADMANGSLDGCYYVSRIGFSDPAAAAFGECVRVLFTYTRDFTGGSAGFPGIPGFANMLFSLICTVLAFFLAWRFIHSKFGRNLTSIRENEMAAEAVGINAFRFKRMSFTFSAIYAGWAGALYAGYLSYIVPTAFNLGKSCELITTTVIGGLGSLTGSVFGAVIVTVLPEIFRSLSEYRMLFYGIAVVLIIMFKPSGLYGYKEFSFKRMVANIKKLVAKITAKSSKGGAANE